MFIQDVMSEVIAVLTARMIPYALTGGLASNTWVGEERAMETFDVDLAVMTLVPDPARTVRKDLDRKGIRVERADDMVFRRAEIHRLWVEGITVDFVRPRNAGFVKSAFRRAGTTPHGKELIRVLAPEDVFLFKGLSKREKDVASMSALAERADFDRKYAERWARTLGVWTFARRALR